MPKKFDKTEWQLIRHGGLIWGGYEIDDDPNAWLTDTGEELPIWNEGHNFLTGPNNEPGKARAIRKDGEMVGSITYNETPDRVYIGTVYVKPEYRGQGLFDILMEPLVSLGKEIKAWNWDNKELQNKVMGGGSPYQPSIKSDWPGPDYARFPNLTESQ